MNQAVQLINNSLSIFITGDVNLHIRYSKG